MLRQSDLIQFLNNQSFCFTTKQFFSEINDILLISADAYATAQYHSHPLLIFLKYQQHVQNLNIVELEIPRMALTSGTSPVNYLKAFNIILFLTSDEKDVKEALRLGEEIFICIYCLHLLLRSILAPQANVE